MEVTVPFQNLELGETVVFDYRLDGKLLDGFIIKHEDGYSCFQNLCAHIPVALDYDDGDFFHDKIGRIVCKTHGATFQPKDGFCDSGPCTGQSLKRFELKVTDDHFVIQVH